MPHAPNPYGIDTTPNYHRPPEHLIEAAMTDVAKILASASSLRRDEEPAMNADTLLFKLQEKDHTKAAAEWVIDRLVQNGLLKVRPQDLESPSCTGGRLNTPPMISRRYECRIPAEKPTPYERFVVVTTIELFDWWRSCGETNERDKGKPTVAKRSNASSGRGRQKISGVEEERRKKIIADWNRAHEAGVSRKDFCDDYKPKLNVPELEKFVAWDEQRKRRGKSTK